MNKRNFLTGLLTTVGALTPEWAKAAFGIFQVSANVQIPSGVAFQAIDGGPNYYGGGNSQGVNFTKATASFTWNSLAVGTSPTITYAGWDDPKFYPIMDFNDVMAVQADFTNLLNIGINSAVCCNSRGSSGQLALFQSGTGNGIPLFMNYPEYGAFTAQGDTIGSETVAWYTQDEPQNIDLMIVVPTLGNAAATLGGVSITGSQLTIATVGGGGTVSGGHAYAVETLANHKPILTGAGITGSGTTAQMTAYSGSIGGHPGGPGFTYGMTGTANVTGPITVTQAAVPALTATEVGGRFYANALSGLTQSLGFTIDSITGTIALSTVMTTSYTAADGSSRVPNSIGYDAFFFCFAQDTTQKQNVANMYNGGAAGSPFTIGQVAKGTHYGNWIDYFRQHTSSGNVPLWVAIDTGNANTTIPYSTQGIEVCWAAWGSIIHGARGVCYFPHSDGFATNGDTQSDFQNAYMQSPQTATFTGTISAGVLTTTSTVTGTIYVGMISTAGTSGVVIILQQTNNLTTPGKGSGTTFAVATLSGAGTVTGTMTFTQSNAGVGGTGTPIFQGGTPSQQGMIAIVTALNIRIRDMARVINSPFAVVNLGQTIGPGQGYVVASSPALAYVFPSNTGVKNSNPPQSLDYGTAGSSGTFAANAIDCCAKLYQGGTYTTTAGDTISNGFYIFATTRLEENHAPNISVTFTINDPFATSITVLGESRANLTLTNAGTNAVTFTDTFDFAWTTRIYRVNH